MIPIYGISIDSVDLYLSVNRSDNRGGAAVSPDRGQRRRMRRIFQLSVGVVLTEDLTWALGLDQCNMLWMVRGGCLHSRCRASSAIRDSRILRARMAASSGANRTGVSFGHWIAVHRRGLRQSATAWVVGASA